MALPCTPLAIFGAEPLLSECWPASEHFAITLPVQGTEYGERYVLTHIRTGRFVAAAKDGELLLALAEELSGSPLIAAELESNRGGEVLRSALRRFGVIPELGLWCVDEAVQDEQWGGR